METLFVVDRPARWSLAVPGVRVVSARQYLTDPTLTDLKGTRVLNLCRSYAYQSNGYYVSLLAEARGHRPQPDIVTIQDMRTALWRIVADDLDELINRSLKRVRGQKFQLSIYFGETLAKRDAVLGRRLFDLFRAPLLRAFFQMKDDVWALQNIKPINASEVPDSHHPRVIEAATSFLSRRTTGTRTARPKRYSLAILTDPNDPGAPSTERTIRKFVRIAGKHDVGAEIITREDYSRLAEFDALFIRTLTQVDHYTYRFARRAQSEGLAVIDDPLSIVRCTNKVYLAERLAASRVRTPRSVIIHRDNIDEALDELGLPCVLKAPDSSFSRGVKKAASEEGFRTAIAEMMVESDLVIGQEFLPTEFDWRVGVLGGEPLFAAKYFMSRGHWQIIQHRADGRVREGSVEAVGIDDAPTNVIRAALRAARVVGDGLYGVDVKVARRGAYVIEVNDNPNLDAGYEDKIEKDTVYERLIKWFTDRIEALRQGGPNYGR